MKFSDKEKGCAAIRRVADQRGIPEAEVRKEMQAALDAAWDSPDERARELQRRLFPKGKPSLEQFLAVVGRHIKAGV